MADGTVAIAEYKPNNKAKVDLMTQHGDGKTAMFYRVKAVFTGNYAATGMALNCLGMFPNEMLSLVLGPAIAADGSDAYMCAYIPGTDQEDGAIYCYTAAETPGDDVAMVEVAGSDAVDLTGYVAYGYALGY